MSGRPDAGNWARVEELLHAVLALPPDRRAAFLQRDCGGDPDLRAEVEALVRAAEATGDVLRPISVSGRAQETLSPGTRLGPWRLGEPIGQGGMGQVYAAERADGEFKMPVAIKVLKRGLDTDAVLRRFERERNILARLSHPTVARLLDAGVTPDGRPYFAMERVVGVPITDYCRARAPAVPQVLALLEQVCEAVDAAHRHLIVHRDLKPANVLVTEAGEVKLLDFGIAKVLDDEEGSTLTHAAERMLTPAYAAPEQILGEPTTPATDVYALGVMLFQLLTGQLPHRREGLPVAVLAAELRRETTTRPSVAVSRAAGLAKAETRRRSRELEGDLDLIVLKALHAEPQRRYRSAFELGGDLRNYLERRPVQARPDSAGYRLGRFVQRNPLPVAAGGAGVLALLAGLGIALWQAGVARAEAERARRAEVEARASLGTARAVSDFIARDLLGSFDPDHRSTANITLKEMLATATNRVDARFADQPQVAAELHYALGMSYRHIGMEAERAVEQAKAVALFEKAHGGDSRQGLLALHEFGSAKKRLADLRGALALQRDVVARWNRLGLAADDPDFLAVRLETAALTADVEPDWPATVAECRTVLALAEARGGSDDLLRLARMTLGVQLELVAEYAEAEALLRRVVASFPQQAPHQWLLAPRARMGLISVLTERGALDEAAAELAALAADLEGLVPPGHFLLRHLALMQARQAFERGRLDEARAAALRLARDELDYLRPGALSLLTRAELRLGRPPEALQHARALVATARQQWGDEAAQKLDGARITLVEALAAAGLHAEGRELLASVRSRYLARLPPRHPDEAELRRVEALLLLDEGRAGEAQRTLRVAAEILESRLGAQHWRARRVRDELARIAPQAGA